MADNKFIPSKAYPKVGAQDIRNKGYEVQSKDWIDEGLPRGYNNHGNSPVIAHTNGKIKQLHDSSNDGGIVTKTETIVEYTRVPMANTEKVEEYSKFQTEPTRPYTTSPVSNFYWWCKPISQNTAGTHEYGRPHDTGINKYYQPGDGAMHQHLHEHSTRRNQKVLDANQEPGVTSRDGWAMSNIVGTHDTGMNKYYQPGDGAMHQHLHEHSTRRNQKVLDANQEAGVTSRDGWAMSNIVGTEASPKGSPLSKPSNFMETAIVPSKGHVLPPEVSKPEFLLPSIDGREAGRRYAGLPLSAVIVYAPAIDSREAAWKYRGQTF